MVIATQQEFFLSQKVASRSNTQMTWSSRPFIQERFVSISPQKLIALKDQIKNWVAAERKQRNLQSMSCVGKSQQVVPVNAKNISGYDESEHYKTGVKALQELHNTLPGVPKNPFVNSRNMIMLRLLIRNGQRSGAVINCLNTEFEAAQEVSKERFIMKCSYVSERMRIKWSKREEEFLKDSFYDMLSGTVPMSSKNLAFVPRALTHLLFNVQKL
ncbi:hypothetical protein CAPTEDRAFT_210015 [Capitella teleta]|uniref:Uncharacterized protein n=1 Tax=Capitella teleta TaxID=283909 RepID=R7V7F7_CAPTE|nr:hypothetical protein CAPTEDRAFT_210015 [Capitella teleta]|eukprot:ELU14788.1 hypothetical protein CAPTEDRAFT_210015 [Capitella teleta]